MNLRYNLEQRFKGIYRCIWIYKTRLNSVQLILFPNNINESYRIITKKNFGQITEERLTEFINSYN